MSSIHFDDVSLRLAFVYLKLVGFWLARNRAEEWFRIVTMMYSIVAILFTLWLQVIGLYFTWGDIGMCTYIGINAIGLISDFWKISSLCVRRKKFLDLIAFMRKNFWHRKYDDEEYSIIERTKKTCIYSACIYSILAVTTITCYVARPLILNIGKNESDRVLIFKMWLDLPLSSSPYFEIVYFVQATFLYQAVTCYVCYDVALCITCVHMASQFRVLQHRISNICTLKDKAKQHENSEPAKSSSLSREYYVRLKNCVQQHQALIEFSTSVEEVFSSGMLGQLLTFSVLMCLLGYQLSLVNVSLSWRATFLLFLTTNMCQLWMLTYSCDSVIRESVNIAPAIYAASWTHMPMDRFGKMIRKDLLVIVMRSRRACCLTACGFFPISLETYSKMLSTSMSYFTVLKQYSTMAPDI